MPHPTTAGSPGSPPARASGIPVTIDPGQDVHLQRGRPLAELRDVLAACTGRPELRTAALHVDDVRLDDQHVVGQPPLVAGVTLRTIPVPGDGVAAALAADHHVAFLAGPLSGHLHAVTEDMTDVGGLLVGRRHARNDRSLVRVRAAPGHRLQRPARGGRGGRPSHRVQRWYRWREGRRIVVLGPDGLRSVAELRPRPDPAQASLGALLADLVDAHTASPPTGSRESPGATTITAAVLPAVTGVILAVVLHNPLFLVMALMGPLMVLAPVIVRRVSRHRHERGTGRSGDLPVPAERARARDAHSAGPRSSLLHPADLLTGVALALVGPSGQAGAPPGGSSQRSRRAPARTGTTGPLLPSGMQGSDDCVWVAGARPDALALAGRTIVSLHASGRADDLHLVAGPDRVDDWAWSRWLPGSSARSPDVPLPAPRSSGRTMLVVDAPMTDDLAARLGTWHAAHGERAGLLVLAGSSDPVPSWCPSRAVVDRHGALRTGPDGSPRRAPSDGVCLAWLDRYARRVSALAHRGRWTHVEHVLRAADGTTTTTTGAGAPHLPDAVSLADAPRASRPGASWGAPRPSGLRTGIGTGAGGTVVIDLVDDGPHLLVAGTTGAGKSELLQTLVLGLALGHPPDELAVALVDYKGGASFGACARLPHVVGQVTDLDPGAAERALAGLRAELRRRERLFLAVGATDLAGYRSRSASAGTENLPRLLVVVDEFRAMADDHPDFIPGLVRIAAQGRSLGIHLVLATQRPSGAITPDMRANISLRIALRVADESDSVDVVGGPAAAHIPAGLPGRAYLRRGLDAPEMVQTYYAGGPASRTSPGAWPSPRWHARGAVSTWPGGGAGGAPADRGPHAVSGLVDAICAAASGAARPRVPWTPALPTALRWSDVPAVASAGAPRADRTVLTFGLVDEPEHQRQTALTWDCAAGHLLVLGRAGTGRTTALRTLAQAAAAGTTVHLVGAPALHAGWTSGRGNVGTVVEPGDPRRIARLLSVLDGATGRHLVVVDGLEDVQRALGALHRGQGADLLVSALRRGAALGTAFAVGASAAPTSALSALLTRRVILSGRDKHDDLFLGVPSAFAGRGGHPGRGVLLSATAPPVACQVALPDAPGARRARDAPDDRAGTATPRAATTILPVPRSVSPEVLRSHPHEVVVGLGGDGAAPIGPPVDLDLLVCGPHGSGRSTVLGHIAADAHRRGRLLAVVSRDPTLAGAATAWAGVVLLTRFSAAAVAAFVGAVVDAARETRLTSTDPSCCVVDDLDVLAQLHPVAVDSLHAQLADLGVRLVASATTTGASSAFRGVLADLRASRCGIVLQPDSPGSPEVFGCALGWHVEPDLRIPGRGVLVVGTRTELLQVAGRPLT